jgi:xanthine dehydrogenase YagS FAD-binding subunit
MLTALGATLTISGPKGTRDVEIEKFFVLPSFDASRENILVDGEIVTRIQIPASGYAAKSTYVKFKERESLDFAMSAVAAAVEMNSDQTVKQARLVLGGVAPIPWHVPKAEAALVGKPMNDESINAAADVALEGAAPLAKNGYKVPLAKALVRRALEKLKSA